MPIDNLPTAEAINEPLSQSGLISMASVNPAVTTVTYYVDKYFEQTNDNARNYYYLGNVKLASELLNSTNAGIYYTLGDHLGSSSLTLDPQGAITESADYYPYGASSFSSILTDIDNDYEFTGKELDEENDLSYFGARYYNNATGRFVSIDPYGFKLDWISKILANPQYLNNYSYAGNNPVILIDPDGNSSNPFWLYISGVSNAWVSNNAFGLGRVESNDPSYSAGQKLGDVASLTQGMLEIISGASSIAAGLGGGMALCPVSGCTSMAAGVAISIEGVALTSHGASVLQSSTQHIMNSEGNYANVDDIIPPNRQRHILEGDETGGGHKFGAGKNKPEFPQSWSDEQILNNGADIATDSKLNWTWQDRGTWFVQGIIDNINIGVVIDKTKSFIKTIFPIK